MSDESPDGLDVHSAITRFEHVADSFAADLYPRILALLDLPAELASLRNYMAQASTSPLFLSFEIVLVVAPTAGTFLVLARQVKARNAASCSLSWCLLVSMSGRRRLRATFAPMPQRNLTSEAIYAHCQKRQIG